MFSISLLIELRVHHSRYTRMLLLGITLTKLKTEKRGGKELGEWYSYCSRSWLPLPNESNVMVFGAGFKGSS